LHRTSPLIQIVLALFVTLLLQTAPLIAQTSTAPVISEEEQGNSPTTGLQAPVIVDGKEIFAVRGSTALPASERANKIAAKIVEAAVSRNANFALVEQREGPLGPLILAEHIQIMVLTPEDAELNAMSVELATQIQIGAIRETILAYRAARSHQARVDSAVEVVAWSIAFAVFALVLLVANRRLNIWIARIVNKRIAAVETATNRKVQSEAVASLLQYGLGFLLLIVFFLGLYYYLSLALSAIPETRAIAQLLLTYVTGPVVDIVLGFVGFIPNLITLLIIIALTTYIIKGLRIFFDAVSAGTFDLGEFEPHWINPTFNICRIAVILVALVFAFPHIPGSGSAAFQGLTILVGAMLSLGSNSVISNVLSGLFVIYRRSTNLGDRIKVGEHTGDVVQIKLMETHIKSIKNELVSIPNALLLNSDVVNYTHKVDGRGLLVHTSVGIGYEEPPEKVEAMLIEAARRTRDLKKSPEPFVLWTALADYAINYEINAFCTRGGFIPRIKSDLHRNIVAVFNENRVQIMTPSYIADPEQPKLPPVTPWDGTLAGKDDTPG